MAGRARQKHKLRKPVFSQEDAAFQEPVLAARGRFPPLAKPAFDPSDQLAQGAPLNGRVAAPKVSEGCFDAIDDLCRLLRWVAVVGRSCQFGLDLFQFPCPCLQLKVQVRYIRSANSLDKALPLRNQLALALLQARAIARVGLGALPKAGGKLLQQNLAVPRQEDLVQPVGEPFE